MKRFVDTERFRDPWFRRLSPEHKIAWDYIWATCDNAGVVVVDWDLFTYLSRVAVKGDEVLRAFGDHVVDLKDGRWWIPSFIGFQFGEELTEASPVHRTVIALLHKHNLDTLALGYLDHPNTLSNRVQERERDRDRERDKEGVSRGNQNQDDDQATRIYRAYPLHVGKPAALKAIQRALRHEEFNSLLDKTLRFATARQNDLAYCPHPSTWFNQERYNDPPETWVRNGEKPQTEMTLEEKDVQALRREAESLKRRFPNPGGTG